MAEAVVPRLAVEVAVAAVVALGAEQAEVVVEAARAVSPGDPGVARVEATPRLNHAVQQGVVAN